VLTLAFLQTKKSFIEKKPLALKKLGKEGKNMMIRYSSTLFPHSRSLRLLTLTLRHWAGRFLSIEAGFDYLQEINFIEPEMELWRSTLVHTLFLSSDSLFSSLMQVTTNNNPLQNNQYAIDIEADLDEAFSENVYSNGG
jgi:hypothetical protein